VATVAQKKFKAAAGVVMRWGLDRSAAGAAVRICLTVPLAAMWLAGCNTTQSSNTSFAGKQGATVAFDSIAGAPRVVFDRLVQDLNAEAQKRQVAVVSRDGSSSYRVRGYLVAEGSIKQSAVSWVWDVYNGDRQRVLRITGEQTIKGKHRDAWQALDEAGVQKIAQDSMVQLAAFLTSPDAQAPAQVAYSSESSPEAAGFFRIFSANATSDVTAEPIATDGEQAVNVPLPPQKPQPGRGTVALAMPPR
jgi:hypothetical protein